MYNFNVGLVLDLFRQVFVAESKTSKQTDPSAKLQQIYTQLVHSIFYHISRAVFKQDRLAFALRFVRVVQSKLFQEKVGASCDYNATWKLLGMAVFPPRFSFRREFRQRSSSVLDSNKSSFDCWSPEIVLTSIIQPNGAWGSWNMVGIRFWKQFFFAVCHRD